MTTPGTLPAALAFVPNWWQEATDPAAFDALLAGWVRACGWRAAGFIWPAEGVPAVVKAAPIGAACDAVIPAELPEVTSRIHAGETTPAVPTPAGGTRVYAAVAPTGRPAGVVWAERPAGQPWDDADLAYLALTGRTLARSPAVAAVVGPVVDPDRLEQRLADAAVVAGRMAHDFDNILTGILGFADLAAPLLPHGSQQESFVAEIASVGRRGIVFTQQLHALNRSGQQRPNPGSVVATFGREEVRLKPAMHPALRLEKDLPPTLPAVAVEAGPLQAALGHVLENAVEACPGGGTVRVSARTVDLSAADARTFLGKVSAGPHVLVTITDSGPGVKPDVRRRLFAEPFFTTKVRHRGLGLAITYRIAAAHEGGIAVDPAPGGGTQVRLVFPLAATRPAAVSTATPPPAHAPADFSRLVSAAPPHKAGAARRPGGGGWAFR